MKKLIAFILSLCLIFSLSGCQAVKDKIDEILGSSSSVSSSTKSSSSKSSSSSSSSSYEEGTLYPEFDNDFTYLDNFNDEIESYNQLADKTGVCRIHFIDVGQGDCMLIELPDGKIMVIDAGDRSAEVEDAIESYFQKLGVDQIEYVLATHQDADHIGNMDVIFNNYDVLKVFRPYVLYVPKKGVVVDLPAGFNQGKTNGQGGTISQTATYYNFLQMIVDEGSEWEFFNKDSHITGSVNINEVPTEYVFDFLTPTASINDIAYTDANDYSPIVLFSYCGVDILFTGDAEEEVMHEYLNTYGSQYDIEILKVGHHGSYTSTNDEYIKALKPEYSVIQVGLGNSYAHPRQEIVDLLHQNSSTILRNDRLGDITLTICPDGTFFFETEFRADYQSALNGEVA